MMTEDEKRLHRCCFTGHRPEKLNEDEFCVRKWLNEQIHKAIEDGFTTFITGMAMGVDLWAAQEVLSLKVNYDLHLIAATPWPGFPKRWSEEWQRMYNEIWARADFRVNISDHYYNGIFQIRNEYMVDHSNRVIAYYNGTAGGTKNTIDYAIRHGIEVVQTTASSNT